MNLFLLRAYYGNERFSETRKQFLINLWMLAFEGSTVIVSLL